MTFVELAQVVSNLGVIGVLLWFTRAFLNGDILSKGIVDQLVNIYSVGVKDSTDRICKSLEALATSLDTRISALEVRISDVVVKVEAHEHAASHAALHAAEAEATTRKTTRKKATNEPPR